MSDDTQKIGDEERALRFDSDPDALAWARARVQQRIDHYQRFELDDLNDGNTDRATQWRVVANCMDRDFIGGEGCVIAAFDERLPSFVRREQRDV